VAEVVVVGGGLAGLAAAFEAARRGHFVTVLEASGTIGGRGTSTVEKETPLDAGPHLLNYRGPLHVLLTKASKVAVRGRRLRSDQFHRRSGGRWIPLALSSKAIRQTEMPAAQKLELLRLRRTLKKAAIAEPERRFDDWIADQSDELQDELAVWAKMSTWLSPACGCTMEFHANRALHGLWKRGFLRAEHGWSDMVGRLLSALDKLGVEVRSGAKISALKCDANGKVKKVQVEGGRRIPVDIVILALPRKAAVKILQASEIDSPEDENTPLEASLLDLVLKGRFLCEGMMYDQINDVVMLNHYRDDANSFRSVISAMATDEVAGDGAAIDGAARIARIEATLDQTASGWRQQIELRRQTNSIFIAGALPSQNRPQVDHFAERGILLAGDWLESEHWLADAAVDTGLRAGAMIQGRPS
jgi:phytoene dehydrogenase-like protein